MEQNNACQKRDDKHIMTDLLSSEKYLCEMYNTFRSEAATGSVRSSLSSILEDEHHIADELFNEMNARGWYQVESAEQNKIQNARLQFEGKTTK